MTPHSLSEHPYALAYHRNRDGWREEIRQLAVRSLRQPVAPLPGRRVLRSVSAHGKVDH